MLVLKLCLLNEKKRYVYLGKLDRIGREISINSGITVLNRAKGQHAGQGNVLSFYLLIVK